ncbi:MAG: alkaline phosphatase family protein, partial [Phycisphaerales bacterium JB041]
MTRKDADNAGRPARRVLLVGWDGADWRHLNPLLERGEMPNLQRFLAEGVRGNIATLQPVLSPMLWTSIATGKHADRHGILGFAEPDPSGKKARPVTARSRRCKALWNILDDAGRPSGVINWYASHPAEPVEGFIVSDRFPVPSGPLKRGEPFHGWTPARGSVHPADDLEPLAETRVHPMMIGAEQVREFVPGATEEDCFHDPKLRELRVLLAHCATVHNAATAYIGERPWDFLGVYYDAIDRMAHAFMEYNPPRMEHVSEADFEKYKGVMEGCYRLHDLMLGRLMKLIDDNTVVVICSDHGFYSDERRPGGTSAIKGGKPVAWHRTFGMVAMWGPGIKRGEEIHGATLLDVTPTVLRLLGMPVARDMDGRALVQAFEEVGEHVPMIDTYENGTPHALPPEDLDDEAVNREMMRQLRDLGYVGDDDASEVEIDQFRNLGTVYLSTGRPRLAMEQFRRVLD